MELYQMRTTLALIERKIYSLWERTASFFKGKIGHRGESLAKFWLLAYKRKEKEKKYKKCWVFAFSCYDCTRAHIVMRNWDTSNNDVEFLLAGISSSSSSKVLMTHLCHHSAITHRQHFHLHHIWALFCLSWWINLGQDMVIICYGDMHYIFSILSCLAKIAALWHCKYLFWKISKYLLILSWPIFHSWILIYLLVESDMKNSMTQTAQLLQF